MSQAIESAGEEAGISDAGSVDISELGGKFDDFIEEVITFNVTSKKLLQQA